MVRADTNQMMLFDAPAQFPSTRYQGSKLKIVDWIWENTKNMQFKTVLDAFGGTGSVAHMYKQKGKQVTYNDNLKSNWLSALALIEKDSEKLTSKDIDCLVIRHKGVEYPTFVYDTFKDIYFTDEEDQWIDVVVMNISHLKNTYKRAIAYYALFQSCIIKRPYNLFHRKNLYMRLSEVKRGFGNKATWDTPFEIHFRKFALEANQAVLSNCFRNKVLNLDAFDIEESFDLVYIDTPYISKNGVGVDYFHFYHFLEGLVNYSDWSNRIDYHSKHKRLKKEFNPWVERKQIYSAFEKLIEKFIDSILVVSYRSDGIPTIEEIISMLKKYKTDVEEIKRKKYKYVLSNSQSEEVLLIAK